MEGSSIIEQEREQWAVFLSQGAQHRNKSREASLCELMDILTADGQFVSPSGGGLTVVQINENKIDQTEFLARIGNLPKEQLEKVLAFPYDILSYTGGTHGSGGGEISIPWMIQCTSKFATDGDPVKSLYEKLSQTIFAKSSSEVKLALHKKPH